MRFRLLRRVLVVAFFAISCAATIYTARAANIDPRALLATMILGLLIVAEPILTIADKLLPDRELQANPHAENRTEVDYLNSLLKEFENEETRFVKLAGDTIIKTRFSIEGEKHEFDDIDEAVASYKGRFVLVGIPGTGKSTTLRHLIAQKIREYQRDNTSERLPVRINLGLSSNPADADKLLDYWWEEHCYLPDTPEKYIRLNNLSLFMDGLNEMPDENGNRAERAKSLREFIASHPELPVIVTCRASDYKTDRPPSYEDEEMLDLGLPVVYVHDLDEPRIQTFIQKRKADPALWDKIKDDDALRRMAQNPYTLTMLIDIYMARKTLPTNLNDLYRMYVAEAHHRYTEVRIQRENTSLLRLPLSELERRLKQLAFQMIVQGKGTACELGWARRYARGQALKDGFNLGVLIRDGNDVKFYHQSLHGYFAIDLLNRALRAQNRLQRLTKNPVKLIHQIGFLGEDAAPAVESLIVALKGGDKAVWKAVTEVLGKIGDSRAVQALIATLHDENSDVRAIAALSLGDLQDSRAIEPLINTLDDEDVTVRYASMIALRLIRDSNAVEPLIDRLHNGNANVRRGVAVS